MGEIIIRLFTAMITSAIPALIAHFLKPKPQQPEQTKDGALLDVAQQQAEVQHAISEINATPVTVDDAITRLRKRSKDAYPDGNGS